MFGLLGILLGAGLYGLLNWKCEYAALFTVAFGVIQTTIAVLSGSAEVGLVVTLPIALLAAFFLHGDRLQRPATEGGDAEKAPITVTCKCGKEFTPQHSAQDYCSRECYLRFEHGRA